MANELDALLKKLLGGAFPAADQPEGPQNTNQKAGPSTSEESKDDCDCFACTLRRMLVSEIGKKPTDSQKDPNVVFESESIRALSFSSPEEMMAYINAKGDELPEGLRKAMLEAVDKMVEGERPGYMSKAVRRLGNVETQTDVPLEVGLTTEGYLGLKFGEYGVFMDRPQVLEFVKLLLAATPELK